MWGCSQQGPSNSEAQIIIAYPGYSTFDHIWFTEHMARKVLEKELKHGQDYCATKADYGEIWDHPRGRGLGVHDHNHVT